MVGRKILPFSGEEREQVSAPADNSQQECQGQQELQNIFFSVVKYIQLIKNVIIYL
jgi:hypothetical protein